MCVRDAKFTFIFVLYMIVCITVKFFCYDLLSDISNNVLSEICVETNVRSILLH